MAEEQRMAGGDACPTEEKLGAAAVAQIIELGNRRREQAGLLAPFSDGMPYNRERVIQEAKFCLQVEIAARFEVGRRLLLLKENEDVRTFGQILEDHFSGMRRQRAYEYLIFARKAADLPRFRAWAEGKDNWSKALALLEEASEADLAEFEAEQSLLGLPKDKLDRLSVRELKDYIRKRIKQHENELEKAGGDTVLENKRLKKRLEALEAADEDVNKGRNLLEAGDKLLTDGLATLAKADFMLLRKDAAAVAIGRDLIAKVRRIADHLEAEMFGKGSSQ
jgi:hypothetical protein